MKENIIYNHQSVKVALDALNQIHSKRHQTLFVVDESNKLIGALTDGDIRRGLLKGQSIDDPIKTFMNTSYKFLHENELTTEKSRRFRDEELVLIPIVNSLKELIRILDLTKVKGTLPVDAIIMAGGKGKRLRPMTEKVPKPLLEVGGTPILERNVDRLSDFGIKNIVISVNYLGEMIKAYFQDGQNKGINISYIEESKFLGTMGATSLIEDYKNESVLIMNSDLLTNIDYEDFYSFFETSDADMLIATIPYEINIPYAVLENKDGKVMSLKEKPTYTYHSNAGIYLLKRSALDFVPTGDKFDATDLIELLIEKEKKVVSYPLTSYWLDIGKHEDYQKAQKDIGHIKF